MFGSNVEDRAIDRPAIDRHGRRVRQIPSRDKEQHYQDAADNEEIPSERHGLPFQYLLRGYKYRQGESVPKIVAPYRGHLQVWIS